MSVIPLDQTLDQLFRKRQLAGRNRSAGRAGAVDPTDRYEVFTTAGPLDHYTVVASMKQAILLADQLATKAPGTVVSCWSPWRAHCYQVQHDGRLLIASPVQRQAYFDTPEEVVDELIRYIATTQVLNQTLQQIRHNMADLMTRGIYCSQVAVKAFIPIADQAVRLYDDQYGGTQQEQYPHDIRRLTAERLVALFDQEHREHAHERSEKSVEQPKELAEEQPAQTINLDGDETKAPVVINVYAG